MAKRVKSHRARSDYVYNICYVDERPVDEISLQFVNKPHARTLLISVAVIAAITCAFTVNYDNPQCNILHGFICLCSFFLIVSILVFPDGPFIRPHPAVWRLVLGLSVIYLLSLLFILCQSYDTIKNIMYWFYPDLIDFRIDSEKEYGVNCFDITVERIWNHIDVFACAHFFGWILKAMLVRHYGICWIISVTWEITEKVFTHLLPNFAECWWDAFILDILICNGLGIYLGMIICRKLENETYEWESIKSIRSTKGKIRRAILQFTPASWTHVRWLDPNCTYMRYFAVFLLLLFWQVSELNTFFLKHIFEIPPGHFISIGRVILTIIISAPSLRQYYSYVTDPRCKKLGMQCWVFLAIIMTEAIICFIFGLEIFAQTQIQNILWWLLIMLLMTVACLYLCVHHAKSNKIVTDCETLTESPVASPIKKAIIKSRHNLYLKFKKYRGKFYHRPSKWTIKKIDCCITSTLNA